MKDSVFSRLGVVLALCGPANQVAFVEDQVRVNAHIARARQESAWEGS